MLTGHLRITQYDTALNLGCLWTHAVCIFSHTNPYIFLIMQRLDYVTIGQQTHRAGLELLWSWVWFQMFQNGSRS